MTKHLSRVTRPTGTACRIRSLSSPKLNTNLLLWYFDRNVQLYVCEKVDYMQYKTHNMPEEVQVVCSIQYTAVRMQYTTHCSVYAVYNTLQCVCSIQYTAVCMQYTVHCSVYAVYSTLQCICSMQYTAVCMQYTVHCSVYAVYSTLQCICSIEYTAECMQYTVHCRVSALYSTHYAECLKLRHPLCVRMQNEDTGSKVKTQLYKWWSLY
jgi:hypothetical protein